jgi:hypothetical protein
LRQRHSIATNSLSGKVVDRIPQRSRILRGGNTMLTPLLFSGILKMQVPMILWEHLIAFTALYCGLYMGGHTVNANFGERFAIY